MSEKQVSPLKSLPHVLTIAGSDSGGGAGIQADLKTIAARGCYGSSVITGLTAQNTLGVQGVHEVPSEFVIQQLESVWSDTPPLAIKFGMLTSSSTISSLAQSLKTRKAQTPFPVMVLDPVMISTSGHSLIPSSAVSTLQEELLPLVDWITPNIPEGECLMGKTGSSVGSLQDMMDLARSIRQTYGNKLLLKGGHLSIPREGVVSLEKRIKESADTTMKIVWTDGNADGEEIEVLGGHVSEDLVVDILIIAEDTVRLFVGNKIDTTSTHGTGCTLSSALACALAIRLERAKQSTEVNTQDLCDACEEAIRYTRTAIAGAFPFGKGHGPLNHGVLTTRRALPPPTPSNPYPFVTHLIQSNLPLWQSYVRHPFVVQLGKGTLPRDSFEHYIKQDYHYLRHYARAHALGAFKASQFAEIEAFTDIAKHIAKESNMHVSFCAEFGITLPQLLATPESAVCAAYARYILDVGAQGDILDLYMAVASCLIGYGEVGLWLQKEISSGNAILEGNPYRRWIEDYSGEDFQNAVTRGIENLERRVAEDPPSPERLAKLTAIWHECVRLERDFWEMGLKRTY